jgi:hypothetical protein
MSRKQPTSDWHELLKLLRRIILLAAAAYGLARNMPYLTLAVRLALLWAVLYMSSGMIDLVVRRLSYRAALRQRSAVPSEPDANATTTPNSG